MAQQGYRPTVVGVWLYGLTHHWTKEPQHLNNNKGAGTDVDTYRRRSITGTYICTYMCDTKTRSQISLLEKKKKV